MKLPPLAGPHHPAERKCPLNQTRLFFPLIFISLEDDSSIVIPPQPTAPEASAMALLLQYYSLLFFCNEAFCMYNKEQIDAEFMKTHGFRKKGTAFFRVLASEILQVVKTEKGRGRAEIQFGVFSLYSELLPQWLTSSGCIPRYHVLAMRGNGSFCDSGTARVYGQHAAGRYRFL